MKKLKPFKSFMAIAVMFFAFGATAQPRIVENFNYTLEANIIGQTNTPDTLAWSEAINTIATAGTTGSFYGFTVTESLIFPGYAASGVGQAGLFHVFAGTTNQDYRIQLGNLAGNERILPAQSDIAYMAFMLRIDSVGSTGGMNLIGFSQSPTAPNTRMWVQRVGTGENTMYRLGITKGNSGTQAQVTWAPASADLNPGETYLIVLETAIVASGGSTDPTVESTRLFINPVPGQPRPTPIVSTNVVANNQVAINAISGVFLRANGSNAYVAAAVGGIRVATTWEEAVAEGGITPSTLVLEENFDACAVGSTLVNACGWTLHATEIGNNTAPNTATFIVAEALEVDNARASNYIASGVGNAARFVATSNAPNFRNSLTNDNFPITEGDIYLAVMVRINAFAPGAGDGFLGFHDGTSDGIRIWGRNNNSPAGHTQLGIGLASNGNVAWGDTVEHGATNLIVMRFTAGGTEIQPADFWVNPEPGVAKPTPSATATGSSSRIMANVTSLFTRSNQNSLVDFTIGGIRIARTWEDAVAEAPPTGDPSLALENLVVAATDLPAQTFMGAGPFVYTLQNINYALTPAITINPLTPQYVTVTATHGTAGATLTSPFQIPMPLAVLTDTVVFTLTGTEGEIDGETATFLVIFEKDTVLPRVASVVPAEGAIPASGNIVVTFNKPMTANVALNAIATINGAPVTATLAGAVLTIPYTTDDWNNLDMQVVIDAGTLIDAVLNENASITLNFTQNMTVPNITAARVSGANLQGATGLPISFVANLEFIRPDVVRDPAVEITLNGNPITVTGTNITLSGLDYNAKYILNIPAGAFMVATNSDLKSGAFSAEFETGGFQIILGTYRQITGGPFRAFRRIEDGQWARGLNAYSGDTAWFYTRRTVGHVIDEQTGDTIRSIFEYDAIANTNTANVAQGTEPLYDVMLSPNRFDAATAPFANPFSDEGLNFHASAKGRLVNNAHAQFIFRVESTDLAEIAMSFIRSSGSTAPINTVIDEIAFSSTRLGGYWLWTDVEFDADSIAVRGTADVATDGPFILTARNFSTTIPQGRYVRIRTSSSLQLVEAHLTPSQAFLEASYSIVSVTYNNAAGAPVQGANAPTDFVASVNFGSNSMVMRNTSVMLTLNGEPIEEEDISHTLITFEDLEDETDFTLILPEGAWVSTANPDWLSPLKTVTFSTRQEDVSNRPESPTSEMVSIHPNPVSDILHVEAENMRLIEIIDMLGRTAIRKATSNDRESIDVSNLREGMYFIRVTTTNEETVVTRFIKQ